jgi:hypothetical protein
MVTRLNSEIFQLAGQIANTLPSHQRAHQRRKPGNITNDFRALGNDLLKFLNDSCAAADPSAAIQLGIQVVLISHCTHLISFWHRHISFDHHYKSVYWELQHTGES